MKKRTAENREERLVRINRYLAMCGVASRRASDQLVEAGRVMINGSIIMEPGLKVDPSVDEVIVDGRMLALPEGKKVYILFNKPKNVITTNSDEKTGIRY